MAYVSIAGVSLLPDAYIANVGTFLPINSAMNPLLYSKVIGHCMSRTRKWVMNILFSICPRHVDDAANVERTRGHIL